MNLTRFLSGLLAGMAIATSAFAQLDPERLLRAVEIGDIPFISNALDRGADPDTADQNGNTLLAAAAAEGNRFLRWFEARFRAVASWHGRAVRWLLAHPKSALGFFLALRLRVSLRLGALLRLRRRMTGMLRRRGGGEN